eukprot:11382277-Ditylum_brightwellii.AAC.1
MAVVDEVDIIGIFLDLQDSDDDSCAIDNDGSDGGPTLLQTIQPPNVEFQGSLYVGGRMASDYTNVPLALGQLKNC